MTSKSANRMRKSFLYLFLGFLPITVSAQVISLKTVPIATGNQFMIFPSQNLGSGGISIAVDDLFLDPFINPAKGSRILGAYLFSSPTFYRISGDLGGGNSLPLAVLFGSENYFGGLAVSIQQLQSADLGRFTKLLSQNSLNNLYFYGAYGKRIDKNTAIGLSVFRADLNGMDGVDLLYPRSRKIDQYGSLTDVRLGIVSETDNARTYEAIFLYNYFDMTHEVTYTDWIWDSSVDHNVRQTWVEENRDKTKMWGFHLGYVQPLYESDWRIGGIFTFNRKYHPKIPNYELMNIPKDPGNTWAYNFGLGLSQSTEIATFGIDVIYEPIWSNTWADAGEYMTSRNGNIIPPWGKTVENDFRFSNALIRMGFMKKETDHTAIQGGIEARMFSYQLIQKNYVEEFQRIQNEHWTEWTLSLGFIFDFKEIQIRYAGLLTMGTGRPGIENLNFPDSGVRSLAANDILLAPAGSLTLQGAHVLTHQITVSVPIRN